MSVELNKMCELHQKEQNARLLAEHVNYAKLYKLERTRLEELESGLETFEARLGKAMKLCDAALLQKREARAKCDRYKETTEIQSEVERLTCECDVARVSIANAKSSQFCDSIFPKALIEKWVREHADLCVERDAMIAQLNAEFTQQNYHAVFEHACRTDMHYITQRNNMESLAHSCDDLKTQISDTSFTINRMRFKMIKTKNPCYKKR
jgi:hypothetical protein